MERYAAEPLNKIRRNDRANYEVSAINAVLDEAMVAHVGFIVDGRPVVIPMVYGRAGNAFYLHGARGGRFAKVTGGLPVCATVTLVDGVVVARSAFHMSANYRSVVLHGRAELVADPKEAERALAAITDHVLPGRWAETRPMMEKELKATSVLRLDIEAASLKSRSGMPIDDKDDYELPIWGGVVPMHFTCGTPKGDGLGPQELALPASVRGLVSRRTASG